MKTLDGGNKMDEKEFVQAYVEAMKKRKASEEKAQLIQDEMKALEDLDADAFDDPPAKKQKLVEEEPAQEESEQSIPADEEEQETSTSRRPRRARNPKRKKKQADDLL